MTTLQHSLLKDPICKNARECFNELQKDDEANDEAIDVARAWIGRLLEKVEFESVAKVFDIATDTKDFLGDLAKDFTNTTKMTAFCTSDAKDWVAENFKEKVEKSGELKLGSEKWSPLANAVYKVGRKACVTILPILAKGTIATALGPAILAGGPLWILGVIITYSVAQEKLERAKMNAWLSDRLIENLNKCRGIALKKLLERKGRETATMAKAWVDDEEKVVLHVLVNKKDIVRIMLGDLRIIALILTTNKVSLEDMNGGRANLSSLDSDVVWPLARIFIFLKYELDVGIPNYATVEKFSLNSLGIEDEIIEILDESSFKTEEGAGSIKVPLFESIITSRENKSVNVLSH